MANEWVLLKRKSLPVNRTVADGTGIEKGTLLKLTDANTAIASSATGDACAGVAAAEKIASSGVTTLPVFEKGEFKASLSGSCTVGDFLKVEVDNHVRAADQNTLSGSRVIGTALETGANGETIRVKLNVE